MMTKKYDKALRKARDQFHSARTQAALRDSILDVPGVTVFDAEHIIKQLFKRLRSFTNLDFKQFRAAARDWTTRQARLVVTFRAMLPSLKVDDRTATLLYLRLPEFDGTDDEFGAWLTNLVNQQEHDLRILATWIREHQRAVYRGIWRVLRSCRDLDNNLADVADCLASKTWEYVSNNIGEFLGSSKAVSKRLSAKAKNFAREWKSARLRDDGPRPAIGFFIGQNGLERIVRGENGATEDVEVAEDEIRDPNSDLNPIIISRVPWTYADFDREVQTVLRMISAGPFRPDEEYDENGQVIDQRIAA